MTNPQQAYENLLAELREMSLISSTGSLLSWDQQTLLPPKAGAHRGDQLAFLAKLGHERLTSPRLAELLSEIEGSALMGAADSDVSTNVREVRRAVDKARKMPTALVQELARTSILGQQAWVVARKASDFKSFAPMISKVFDLKRQEAECLGYVGSPYNALLDTFEPGDTVANLIRVFDSLRGPLVDLIGRIAGSPRKGKGALLSRPFPRAGQEAVGRAAAAAIGFDFEAGRIDASPHPFCSNMGPYDTRITSRYDEGRFSNAFFATLHEMGHGLYEQGRPAGSYGTPCGEYISMGIHESQSRLWENLVGRRRSFWSHFLPKVQATFPSAAGISVDDWYQAVNHVEPSLIRVEADELTYNLHVLLRFELEVALLKGDLAVADLPGAWNDKMKAYLGVTPPTDALGVLQDVHWSACLVGYFPTYTLGNLYGSQFYEQAQADLGDLDAAFRKGEFAPLLGWLRSRIHGVGHRYSAPALVERVTGKPLSAEPFLRHVAAKAADIYGV
jgi:carboxypeptidase Taq